MDLLRFATAGSVDDGKSTLIGRLLYDTKSIFEDQLEALAKSSLNRGEDFVNLALLTDGLRAEREQGITIDVAYRYFATPKRKFILADAPGHIQYTRNLVTAVSGVNLVVIMIDARHGVVEQTRRHTFIAELLGIKHLIVCINKMDLVDYDEKVYDNICHDFSVFISKTKFPDVHYVPVSALKGDNIADSSVNMPWYKGTTILYLLETVKIAGDYNMVDCRFPVQTVIRPQTEQYHDYRGYAGRIAGGVFKKGDEVVVLPAGFTTKIKSIDVFEKELDSAFPPLSVSIQVEDDIDISRGDMIVKLANQPTVSQDLSLMICWLDEKKMVPGGRYILRHTTRECKCIVKEVLYKLNINTLHRYETDKEMGLNDIGRINIKTSAPVFFDKYELNKITGSTILVDEHTNNTVAAGIIK